MNMIAVLDADEYYGALDYMESMKEEYGIMAHNTVNDRLRYYYLGTVDTLRLVYEFLAKAEITPDDIR